MRLTLKICAIICEYNPFHNGHKYLIEQAKIKSGCDAVLCLMSGNFVQRAEAAVIDKYVRAKLALMNGADIILQIPTIFSIACGEIFSSSSIRLLNTIPDITHLAFGCENNNIDLLQNLAYIQNNESEEFKIILQNELDKGNSYPSSYSFATVKMSNSFEKDTTMLNEVLCKPNNLLAIEYLKAINMTKSKIIPLPITRIGSEYNNQILTGKFSSASSIRNQLDKNINIVCETIPKNCFEILKNELIEHKVNNEIFEALIINSIRAMTMTEMENLYDAKEGIENKLYKNAQKFTSISDILFHSKSKRYTMARLKRLLMQSLLKIDKDIMRFSASVNFSRVLGINSSYKDVLKILPKHICVKNQDINSQPIDTQKIIEIEKRASNIYSLLTHKQGNQFYENKLLTI